MAAVQLLLRPGARVDQSLPLGFERIAFLREGGQNRVASQKRIIRGDRASAEDDSIHGNKLTREGGVLEMLRSAF